MKRSRRLQAGLAGLSLVSAVGAAVGLGLTTHTGSAAQANQGSDQGTSTGSHERGEGNDDNGSSTTNTSSHRQKSSPVTQPTTTAPQATTSGS
jgi:hypothetical protein